MGVVEDPWSVIPIGDKLLVAAGDRIVQCDRSGSCVPVVGEGSAILNEVNDVADLDIRDIALDSMGHLLVLAYNESTATSRISMIKIHDGNFELFRISSFKPGA